MTFHCDSFGIEIRPDPFLVAKGAGLPDYVHSGSEKGWTGSEQLVGSRYASTKRAEKSTYIAAYVAIICTKR